MTTNRRMQAVNYGGQDRNAAANRSALPADAGRMIARWQDLDRPAIELEPGVIVTNLERWLHNNPPAAPARLGRVREYLYIDTLTAPEALAA